MDLITTLLNAAENGAIVVLIANVLTLFIDDSKLAKAGPFIGAIGKFLNVLALNIGSNKNPIIYFAHQGEAICQNP